MDGKVTLINQLKENTKMLLESTGYLMDTFIKVKASGKGEDFYEVVVPFANKVKKINEDWKVTAINWVVANKPEYLHAAQIQSASDHLEIISVSAFYPDTSKKRFMDAIKSVQYILEVLLSQLSSIEKK
ncbi:hypothetical protein NCCP28_03660 [Niallia sp. NCCP-28]|nr:hypothetical protein NCCP28_03660 [Niallia sp. NCCP-28]